MSIIEFDYKNCLHEIGIERSEKAFRRLFLHFYTPLIDFSKGYLKNRELAEEIISDVFMSLWKKGKDIIDIRDIKIYLFKSVKNTSLNYLAKIRNFTSWDLDNISTDHNMDIYTPEHLLLDKEFKQKLLKEINALPFKCQLVFKLVREYSLTYKEVAKILDISEKTVDRHLTIAHQKIKIALQSYLQIQK